jgi:hypothetical protein
VLQLGFAFAQKVAQKEKRGESVEEKFASS